MAIQTDSCIILLATDWGPRFGGINSFNQELTNALGTWQTDFDVICVVQRATSNDIVEAKKKNVLLVQVPNSQEPKFDSSRLQDVLNSIPILSEYKNKWWIGHDTITGDLAKSCAKKTDGQFGLIHHMNYDAYLSYKERGDSKTRIKVEQQRDLLASADVVYGIGPKLEQSAREKTRSNSSSCVVQLVPGLPTIDGLQSSSIFSAVVFARLDKGNDQIKQARLAAISFANARSGLGDPLGNDATLTVIGLDSKTQRSQHQELLNIAERRANRAVHIHGWPYIDDRNALYKHLRDFSVCMMLSLHEGFGLAGWEAIAAEVPLILSSNSGLFQLIESKLGGSGTGCILPIDIQGSTESETFREEDVVAVSKALIKVSSRIEEAKNNAKTLKRMLSKFACWQKCAEKLVEQLLRFDSSSDSTATYASRKSMNVDDETRFIMPEDGDNWIILMEGPSCSGKDVILNRLRATFVEKGVDARFLRKYTTRKKRQGERKSEPYDFVSPRKFEKMFDTGRVGFRIDSYSAFYGIDKQLSPNSKIMLCPYRLYSRVSDFRRHVEAQGYKLYSVLLDVDWESLRARSIMRTFNAEEREVRTSQILEDLPQILDDTTGIREQYDLVVSNGDDTPISNTVTDIFDAFLSKSNFQLEIKQ